MVMNILDNPSGAHLSCDQRAMNALVEGVIQCRCDDFIAKCLIEVQREVKSTYI